MLCVGFDSLFREWLIKRDRRGEVFGDVAGFVGPPRLVSAEAAVRLMLIRSEGPICAVSRSEVALWPVSAVSSLSPVSVEVSLLMEVLFLVSPVVSSVSSILPPRGTLRAAVGLPVVILLFFPLVLFIKLVVASQAVLYRWFGVVWTIAGFGPLWSTTLGLVLPAWLWAGPVGRLGPLRLIRFRAFLSVKSV